LFDFLKKTKTAVKSNHNKWFNNLSNLLSRSAMGEDLWDDIEEILITADVGMGTADKLIRRVKERMKAEKIDNSEQVLSILKDEIVKILQSAKAKPFNITSSQGPAVILVIGANGCGKTTSIAKLSYNLKNDGKKVILAAADTFRAAAIDQLKLWGERTGIEVIAHQPGSDPGAVVFDAMQAAKSRNADVVVIDTAGRLHTKYNLMEELKKVKRVISRLDPSAPHETLIAMDATTGQNGLSQAKHFSEAVGITGIILTKLDSTAKGGVVLGICDELQIPIRFVGTGETLEDLVQFDAQVFVDALSSPNKGD
jgi:fused signal recognition particle receptor